VSEPGEGRPSARVLYIITCGTPAARDVGKLVALAQAAGWTVCVIATPQALKFLDREAIEAQTGFPVRSDYKQPGTPDVLPSPDALIVGGASSNTLIKWALGISDTLALGLLTEAIGMGLPLVALPFLNSAQAAHPGFGRSVAELRAAGVHVLLGPEGYEPHVPRQGSQHLPSFPWAKALEAVEERSRQRGGQVPKGAPTGAAP
jgi:phosphopantothenoylcysteine synthetase/decarboxylase